MKKTVKTIGATAALAVMIPLSAYAATANGGAATGTAAAGQTASATTQSAGHWKGGDLGGKGGQFVGQDVLDLLKLDQAGLKAKFAEGKTLAQIAEAQGVTRDALKKAMTDSFNKQLDERRQAFTAGLDKTIDAKPGDRMDKAFGFGGLTEAAKVLHLTDAQLKTELKSGKSIADVAKAKNVDVQKVIDAEKTALTAAINQAVKDGKLTQAEADKRLTDVAAQADRIVNDNEGQEGHGKHGFGDKRGGHDQ